MDDQTLLFQPDVMMRFQMKLKQILVGAAMCPLLMAYTGLFLVALTGLGILEYEIIYRVFEYLSGEDGYWSPRLMGLSAAVMIVGYHVLAEKYPDNIAVRIIDTVVRILIPVYLLGAGLYVASALLNDQIAQMDWGGDVGLVIGEIPDAVNNGNWLERILTNVTDPAAMLAFSIGIGGLAIVNIFISHHLLVKIKENIGGIYVRINRAKEAIKAYADIKKAQLEYAEVSLEIGDIGIKNDPYLIREISAEVMGIISDALMPHKVWLKEHEYESRLDFEPALPADPKKVAKDIAKIETITVAEIAGAIQK